MFPSSSSSPTAARGLSGASRQPPAPGQSALGQLLGQGQKDGQDTQLKELRYHLAVLRQKEASAADGQRYECEALLEGAVELRAEKRYLEQESSDCRRHLALIQAESNVVSEKWDRKNMAMHTELAAQKAKLDEARHAMSSVNSEWILEDEPEEACARAQKECLLRKAQQEEWVEATYAAEELSERLSGRLGSLEEECYLMKHKERTGGTAARTMTKAGFKEMQEETRMLATKVVLESSGVDAEARRLWIHGDGEIPRLQQAEAERKRLQRMLQDTRWQHDSLQRDYDRVLHGLAEQERAQEVKAEDLAESISETRDEGEEMLASVKQNDMQIAEMRHDRLETELFVQHLNSHIARLEDERVNLNDVVKDAATAQRRPGFDPNLRRLGPDGADEVLEWLKQDRDRLLSESQSALDEDMAEAEAVEAQCEDAEEQLMQCEQRNAVLRSEVSMAEPMLANKAASSARDQQGSPGRRPAPQEASPGRNLRGEQAGQGGQSSPRPASPKDLRPGASGYTAVPPSGDEAPEAKPKKKGFFRNRTGL